MQLEEIWDLIGSGDSLENKQAGLLKDAYQAAVGLAHRHERPWECWYAASRAAYLLRCRDFVDCPEARHEWEASCLAAATRSLACRKGYLPAILCILHLWMDQGQISKAAVLALSLNAEAIGQSPHPILADRLMEARICCLAEIDLWQEAETEMRYFERRRREDPHCGIDLINFFKFLKPRSAEEYRLDEASDAKSRVLAAIADLVNGGC